MSCLIRMERVLELLDNRNKNYSTIFACHHSQKAVSLHTVLPMQLPLCACMCMAK